MSQGLKQMFHGISFNQAQGDDDLCESVSFSSDSDDSVSLSSSDLTEDATSSSNSSPQSSSSSLMSPQLDSNGPLYELSSLMAQLPIKRGLSKYYDGKSQSFTSLSNVRGIEDLAKKESPSRKKMKPCQSYGGGLDESQKAWYAPGPCSKTISKKASRGSCASLVGRRSSTSFLCSSKPPSIPLQKN